MVGEHTSTNHKRLGHLSLWIVKLDLSRFAHLVSSNKVASSCSACPRAKRHQLPFNKSTSLIFKPLELIYFDV